MLKRKNVIEIEDQKYVLNDQIGGGDFGTVWLAESEGNQFAIKFINSKDNTKVRRFENEIAICKNANHRNIVKVISEGSFGDMPCYVMGNYP